MVPPQPAASGPAQVCADLVAKGAPGLYLVQVEAEPELVWEAAPHMFRVGVCNTNAPTSKPAGQYRAFIFYPGSSRGHAESDIVHAEVNRGYNTVMVGPWVPGLENHIASCNSRRIAQVEIRYDDTPDKVYKPLAWPDGRTSVDLPVACGGNYP